MCDSERVVDFVVSVIGGIQTPFIGINHLKGNMVVDELLYKQVVLTSSYTGDSDHYSSGKTTL